MYKNSIKMMLLAFSMTLFLYGEVDIQKNIYDAAEEMMRFDEKMNRAIAEHNRVTPEEDAEMQLESSMIRDFEERADSYLLEREIPYPDETEVEVTLEDGLLTVTMTTIEREEREEDLNISTIMMMNSSSFSLFLPPDADENRVEKYYNGGVLMITIAKK